MFSVKRNNDQKSSQLESALNWTAKDSIVLDMENKQTYLYKEAHIDYGEVVLDACYIKFDFESKNVHATYCLDSNNQKTGRANYIRWMELLTHVRLIDI